MPKFNDSERNFVTFTTTLHKTMEHLKFCDKAPHQFYARLTNCRLQGTGTEMTCVEQSNAGMGGRRSSVPTVVTIRLHSYIQSHPPRHQLPLKWIQGVLEKSQFLYLVILMILYIYLISSISSCGH